MVSPSRVTAEPVIDGPLPTALGYQQIDSTTLSTAQALTVPTRCSMALLQAEGGNIRWRPDGVDPTGTVGMLIKDGNEVMYAASESALMQLKFIRAAVGAILNVAYY